MYCRFFFGWEVRYTHFIKLLLCFSTDFHEICRHHAPAYPRHILVSMKSSSKWQIGAGFFFNNLGTKFL